LTPDYEVIHRSVTELMADTERRPELLIVSSKMYEIVLERPDLDPPRAEAYRALFREGELLCEVLGDDIQHSGPTQRLYRLPPLGR
jgi:hypothetical protein